MRKFFTIIGLLALTLMACERDFDVFIPDDPIEPVDSPTAGEISHFFEAAQPVSLGYTIDAQLGATIATASGTHLTFLANSLVDTNAETVTGTVRIEVSEVHSKGDMVVHDMQTTSYNNLIESAGAFYVKASKDGEVLSLKPGHTFKVQIPLHGVYSEKMKVFYGERQYGSLFNWIEADNDTTSQQNVLLGSMFDSSTEEWTEAYEFHSTRMSWVSCSAYTTDEEHTTLEVSLEEGYSEQNTAAFLVFDTQNSMIRIPWNAELNTFQHNYIPLNAVTNVIIISSISENQFHFARFPVTFTNEKAFDVTLDESPLGDILEFLSGL